MVNDDRAHWIADRIAKLSGEIRVLERNLKSAQDERYELMLEAGPSKSMAEGPSNRRGQLVARFLEALR